MTEDDRCPCVTSIAGAARRDSLHAHCGSGKGSSVTSIVELHGIDKSFAASPR